MPSDDITEMSPAEIVDFLKDDPDIIAAEVALAEEAAEYAKSISPEETGEYKNNINAHQEGSEVWLGFDSEIANIIEYGSISTPEFAVRTRTEEYFNNRN